jgi:hypothetical protein
MPPFGCICSLRTQATNHNTHTTGSLPFLPLLYADASIWLHQFTKAMRDDKGEMIRNAHLLGFFRRICRWAVGDRVTATAVCVCGQKKKKKRVFAGWVLEFVLYVHRGAFQMKPARGWPFVSYVARLLGKLSKHCSLICMECYSHLCRTLLHKGGVFCIIALRTAHPLGPLCS